VILRINVIGSGIVFGNHPDLKKGAMLFANARFPDLTK
jgi:NADH:ubiquinone oxidoreductase subunit C